MSQTTEALQDLVIVSQGTAQPGRMYVGSVKTNCIVGEVEVEVVDGYVVVSVHRKPESYFEVLVVS